MLDLTQNYFELFQLSPTYSLDEETLSARYQLLQRHVHPDRYASASAQERRFAMQSAAYVNEAYKVLADRLLRAKYLLHLQGYRANDNLLNESDPGFLMQQIELREQLEDIEQQPDALNGVMSFQVNIRKQIEDVDVGLQRAFKNGDLREADLLLQKAGFLCKLLEEAEERELRLENKEIK